MPSTHPCRFCNATITVADNVAAIVCPGCKRSFKRRPRAASDSAVASGPVPDWPASVETEAPAAETTAGEVLLGRFQIRRVIGEGSFGTVYLAYDPQLDREVALKVPNPGTLADAQRVERFLREARAAGNLHHPSIVALFEAGLEGGTYFIASAYIDGQTLEGNIPAKGMEFQRAARIAAQLAEAVGYAHTQNIIHRDIKPGNVIIDNNGRPHLLDFGLAARSDESEKLTHDGTVLGTLEYMAPEQAAGQFGDAQPASDQYSLGVLLYELLVGKTPFQRTSLQEILSQVIEGKIVPPGLRRRGLPRDLETICLKALSRRPEDRYADCGEMAADLHRWLEGLPIRARRLSPWEIAWRWIQNSLLVAGTVAISVLIVGISVGIASSYYSLARDAQERQTDEQLRRERAEQAAQEEGGKADEASRQADELNAQAARDEDRARVAEEEIKAADTERARLKAMP